jgi:hypothetical protein
MGTGGICGAVTGAFMVLFSEICAGVVRDAEEVLADLMSQGRDRA